MANKYTYQVLRDTVQDCIIKLTGVFDGTGQEANNVRIQANTLYGALDANGVPLYSGISKSNTALPYYDLQLIGVSYFVNMGLGTGTVELFWNGYGSTVAAQYANSATIFHLNQQGDYGQISGSQLPVIYNNAPNMVYNTAQGVTSANTARGDMGVYTSGAAANSSYTLIVAFRKNNAYYQRGQFNDPAAFNFGPYNITP
jgi:hypothetical protein